MATIAINAAPSSATGKLVADLAQHRGHVALWTSPDRVVRGSDKTAAGTAKAVVVIPARGAYEQLGPALEQLAREATGTHLLLVSSFVVGYGGRHALGRATGALPHLRQAEHLLRSGAAPYTIVRPTWLTDDPSGAHAVTLTQDPHADGMLSRTDLARVLVAAIEAPAARDRTFALFNEPGCSPPDWSSLFATLYEDGETRGA